MDVTLASCIPRASGLRARTPRPARGPQRQSLPPWLELSPAAQLALALQFRILTRVQIFLSKRSAQAQWQRKAPSGQAQLTASRPQNPGWGSPKAIFVVGAFPCLPAQSSQRPHNCFSHARGQVLREGARQSPCPPMKSNVWRDGQPVLSQQVGTCPL